MEKILQGVASVEKGRRLPSVVNSAKCLLSNGVKNIYLVGIGGIGMSGLALLLKNRGFNVKGSDIKENNAVRMLQKEGIEVFIGHRPEQISLDTHLLSYSSAVGKDNVELLEAEKKGIPVLKRGKLLEYLCRDKKAIAVGGSHGKTTTTALLSYLLNSLGYEPAVFVGGLPLNYSCNARWGKDHFVIETDESDGSFLEFFPWVSIITNIDYEHLEYYRTIERLEESFLQFAYQTKEKVLGCADDPIVKNVLAKVNGLSFGWGKENKIRGVNFSFTGGSSCFELFINDKFAGSVKIPLLGEYNCLNALAVLAFFYYLGEDLEKVIGSLKNFKGTQRRFQVKEIFRGVTFVDDYAHHPTEIEAVLKAAQSLAPKRLFVIFQPHRFSRVKLLSEKFSRCFQKTTELIITDIYSACEKEIEGIDENFLYSQIKKNFSGRIRYIPKDKLESVVPLCLKEGDLVLGLGAGDINILMENIVHEFKSNSIKA
ncbi:MAG: UDP-N-acetylmuramate--L-alanine ligase [Candidatus Omnitrophica bacterium]|nr:UDP-N-acetylmuramate--L-alanine ligase [Candidatus Omnitrophota bacterium]